MSQVCKYARQRESFQRTKTLARTLCYACKTQRHVRAYCRFVGYTTSDPNAIIRRARRAMLMNIDAPRQYAPLEVNALALLTLRGIESRGPARRKRKYVRDSVAFLFLCVKHVADPTHSFFTFYIFLGWLKVYYYQF